MDNGLLDSNMSSFRSAGAAFALNETVLLVFKYTPINYEIGALNSHSSYYHYALFVFRRVISFL
jgi:hypothetical protein